MISLQYNFFSLAVIFFGLSEASFLDTTILNQNPVTLHAITSMASWGAYGLGKNDDGHAHKVTLWAQEAGGIGFSFFDGSGIKPFDIAEKACIRIPTTCNALKKFDNIGIRSVFESFEQWLKKYHATMSLWSGATMAMILLSPSSATCVHVGDVRIVLEREGQDCFSTLDHVKKGSDGFNLERSLGYFGRFGSNKNAGTPSVCRIAVQKGDHFIIASQALWHMFTSDEIAQFVSFEREVHKTNLSDIAQKLTWRARTAGCYEAISVLIIEVR